MSPGSPARPGPTRPGPISDPARPGLRLGLRLSVCPSTAAGQSQTRTMLPGRAGAEPMRTAVTRIMSCDVPPADRWKTGKLEGTGRDPGEQPGQETCRGLCLCLSLSLCLSVSLSINRQPASPSLPLPLLLSLSLSESLFLSLPLSVSLSRSLSVSLSIKRQPASRFTDGSSAGSVTTASAAIAAAGSGS